MFSQATKTSNNLYGRVGVDRFQALEHTSVIGMGYIKDSRTACTGD